MSIEVPVDSPLKVSQRWGTWQLQGKPSQGLLVSTGSFLQLTFAVSLFTLADHPQRERQRPLWCPSDSVTKFLCFWPSKFGPLSFLHRILFPMGIWEEILPLLVPHCGTPLSEPWAGWGHCLSEAGHSLLKESSVRVFPKLRSLAHHLWDFCSLCYQHMYLFFSLNLPILLLK